MKNNRRDFIRKSSSLVALSASGMGSAFLAGLGGCKKSGETAAPEWIENLNKLEWPVTEGRGTPKLCMSISGDAGKEEMRKVKQIGIDHVMSGVGRIPWKESEIRTLRERLGAGGLSLVNMMIGGFRNVIYGREGRDQEIEKVQQSLRAAGAAGLPVVEYNFYADRISEGYYAVEGRGGAGYTAFDYEPVRDLPPEPETGAHSSEELWKNLTYFLEAVIPVAEEAGVRMALHPNDPPVAVSHGSAQIMRTFDDWKRLISIVDSPSNGITYDCGVTTELGEDAVEVCRYFASRDRINHAHFRNVRVEKPYEKYTEVFPDNGQVNMFAVMVELVRNGYRFAIYPEHQRALDYDLEHPSFDGAFYPGGGGYTGLTYNIAYARAMLQAALTIHGGSTRSGYTTRISLENNKYLKVNILSI